MKPTLIRALDPDLYRRFKAAAVLKGITLSQAFNEAMELWLKRSVESGFKSSGEFTGEFFMKVKDELDKKYRGRYVLLKEDKVVAVVDSLKEAYEVLKDKGLRKCVIYKAGEEIEEGEWGWSSIEL